MNKLKKIEERQKYMICPSCEHYMFQHDLQLICIICKKNNKTCDFKKSNNQ